jgi:hypothetical protein
MKKTYQIPVLTVVSVKTQHILADSPVVFNNDLGGGGSGGSVNGSQGLARQHSVWGEDEEEE